MLLTFQPTQQKTLKDVFLQGLVDGLDSPDEYTAAPVPTEWAAQYRTIDERPFTLENHLPLQQIYNDTHKHIVIMKPAQVGVSELAVTRVVHTLDCGAAYYGVAKAGLNVGYLFPTQTALSDFSKERISGLQTESEKLARLFTSYDDVGFKQAGQSYLYLRGAWSTSALKSFPADVLILDELDEMAARAVALAQKRLRASKVKVEIDISTPTLPGRGIHGLYLQSDMNEWYVPCDNCKAFSVLDFFRDVYAEGQPHDVWQHWTQERLRQAEIKILCQYCHSEMNRTHSGAQWRKRHPEITGIRGYHIPSLCFPMVNLNELAVNSVSQDPTQIEEFFRSDLGIPYEKSGSQITESILDALADDLPLPPWRSTVMGVDVGARWHYRITSVASNGKRYVRKMGAASGWSELDILMKQYNVRRCVVDAAPETSATEAWAKKHSGKVLRAYYNINLKTLFTVKDDGTVSINRTGAMDALYARMSLAEDERWNRTLVNDPEIRAHMKAPTRITVEGSHGDVRADWIHTAPDHYFHASVYSLIAELALPKITLDSELLHGAATGW